VVEDGALEGDQVHLAPGEALGGHQLLGSLPQEPAHLQVQGEQAAGGEPVGRVEAEEGRPQIGRERLFLHLEHPDLPLEPQAAAFQKTGAHPVTGGAHHHAQEAPGRLVPVPVAGPLRPAGSP